ncbi:MAG: DUF3108 domain-containing protein [Bacteroidia bacterium]|nr:DUF3108 domain-containing protein [Bacteroidia bacterium]
MKKSLKLLFPLVLCVFTTSAFQSSSPENQVDGFEFRTVKNTAFKEGEKLTFRVHYGFINAAKVTMNVDGSKSTVNKRKVYKTTVDGRTFKSFDWAFKVRDKFESWVDARSLAPLRYAKSVREDDYTDKDYAIFMHGNKKLKNTEGILNIPSYTQDIASALYYARNLDLQHAKKGDSYPINIYLDNTIYKLSFKVTGKEIIRSDIGKVRCIKLQPKLVVDRVFKGDDDMTIWVTDDANKIPIRIKSALKVGSIKVDLTKYSGLKNNFSSMVKKK